MTAPVDALIALGANLGDPRANLAWAVRELAGVGVVTGVSRVYRTAPVGGPPGQPDYLNAAARLRTTLTPHDVLAALLDIERRSGRERRERWGPRVLDLDLIAYGDLSLDTDDLTLPHPRAWTRAFVLAPLHDVAPDYAHPGTGERVRDALARVGLHGVHAERDPLR
ncbi:2-amino-4-hydroxy-6-hydroxymethyldihydropteridine diphosphokinase [Deinococcus maricopensis]|uniref:2-amino-4-hydroxy-6-hydroxymethyldihydropteridine diphosphokinase n=1 Tax=Deinococcus maricopensis (strain DSM 21211 / LMG 22137 / NRRL B-23946 / LB-34) TaxID=709986 RepID=E8U6A4_DEIML|nr:2-amino-4-hydroxy-6-hydroxymethyldihydropteridine diphosphokinase [Deinococcus maricopensis]ADV66593.1 2-amino-4-hydroxy-6-hydroxymethyldihydropteridin epyrophosphokinase [Deinococcus maricopensis DSM 21211]